MSNGYILVYGNCASCHIPIAYNPLYVPSIRVYNRGEKKAICSDCFEKWNKIHRPKDPLEIHPNAFKPLNEVELDCTPCVESKHTGDSNTTPKNNNNNGVNNNDDRQY